MNYLFLLQIYMTKARKVLLSKGVYVRPPQIAPPASVDFVEKHKASYLTFSDSI